MILVTRLNGASFAVNADLIERIDSTPDTVLSLVDGRKYVVAESVDEVIDRVVAFRAAVLVVADRFADEGHLAAPQHPEGHPAKVLQLVHDAGEG